MRELIVVIDSYKEKEYTLEECINAIDNIDNNYLFWCGLEKTERFVEAIYFLCHHETLGLVCWVTYKPYGDYLPRQIYARREGNDTAKFIRYLPLRLYITPWLAF